MITLTGGSGFVGSSIFKYFGTGNIIKVDRNKPLDLSSSTCLIHVAGISSDLKKVQDPNVYYQGNTELTKQYFEVFLRSHAKVFITLSSVKAVRDEVDGELTEDEIPQPISHYGKSKLLAEEYILSKKIPKDKRVYILRPCIIHGPGNRGNLHMLYNFVSKSVPWPLGAFENFRSYCSIDNLLFIIKELIERDDISSGVYNVADDIPLSTNEVIGIIAQSQNKMPKFWRFSKVFLVCLTSIGDKLGLPINSELLNKLTSSYVVSNVKIKSAIGKPLPLSSREGLLKTFKSFNNL